jgi:putative nucleotidyltransferase with HDIG domain
MAMYRMNLIVGEKSTQAMRDALLVDVKLRWIISGVSALLVLLYWKLTKGALILPFICILAVTAGLNIAYNEMIKRSERYLIPMFAVTGFIDIVIITFVVAFSGGMASPLFLIYYFVLLDSCFDYWSNQLYYYFAGFITACYAALYLVDMKGVIISHELSVFVIRVVFLIIVGQLGHMIAEEMREQHENLTKVSGEKERLYEELRRINVALEEKVNKATENLEKTNLMLVKKNISLLAAHEIYKTANESRTKEELLLMALGIIFPLMKGNGGIVFSMDEGRHVLKLESYKKIIGTYEFETGYQHEITAESEFYEVLVKKKARLIDEAATAKDEFIKTYIKSGSCIAAPLIARGEITGLIIVFNRSPYIYNKTDAELIELLGEQIGMLLYNRVLYEEMRIKAAGLEKLMSLTINLEASLEIEEIISRALVDGIKKVFLNSSGVVMLLSESNELKIKAQYGYKSRMLDRKIPTDSIAGWVFKNNKSLFIKDVKKIKFFNPSADGEYMKDATLIVPISSPGKVAGVMSLTRQGEGYTREELYFLSILSNHLAASIENARLYLNVKKDYINTIYALATAVDAKDHYTHGHSATVMKYSTKVAEMMEMSEQEIENVKYAGLLHDIGKIGISESIINKPGKLTNDEYAIIKMHPQLGANIISKIDSLKKLVPLVLSHHEWANGAGYPLGLRGEEIPMGARIISVADAFSTITSKRPYREERSIDFAIKEIQKYAGTQFDARVVNVFVKLLRQEEESEKAMKEAKAAEEAEAAAQAAAPAAPPAEDERQEKKDKKRIRVRLDEENKDNEQTHKDEDFYS